MRLAPTLLALTLSAAPLHAQDGPLSVIRHVPGDSARSGNVVSVTFDRPVAGRLDATVDASRIFHLEPATAGRVEWRDPVTIRFVPSAPLTPGITFTVTVDTLFTAVDGSRLQQPYRFTFRVPGPRLLARSFGGEYAERRDVLPLDGRVELLYSAPVELNTLDAVRLELHGCAAGDRTIPLRVTRQRTLRKDERYDFREAGGRDRDRTDDRFRRVVELEPVAPVPEDCAGLLVIPTMADDGRYGPEERFAVSTAASFRIVTRPCDPFWGCPLDDINLSFTAGVSRDEVLRHVHLEPAAPLVLADQGSPASSWRIQRHLAPRTTYTVIIDPELRDVNGRAVTGPRRVKVTTGDYKPALGHAIGVVTVPRAGSRTIPLRHVNVQAVRIITYIVPEHARAHLLAAASLLPDTALLKLAGAPQVTNMTLDAPLNVERTTELPLPQGLIAAGSGVAVLDIQSAGGTAPPPRDSAHSLDRLDSRGVNTHRLLVVQLSDLAVHAKAGPEGGIALVTGLPDGRPRAGARVRELDADGHVVAEGITGRDGTADLRSTVARATGASGVASARSNVQASGLLIEATLGDDRVVTPLTVRALGYRPWSALEPARVGGRSEIAPAVEGTLFTDRGIYRPGEMLYLTGVVREGTLSALKLPTHGDSVRLRLLYRPNDWYSAEDVTVRDTVLRMTEFGTVTDSTRLRAGLSLGTYVAELGYRGRTVATEELRVAEYRAPEFLVDTRADSAPLFGGDTARVDVAGRYLFGAPMGRARVAWRAVLHEISPWELHVPGAEGWQVGESEWWGQGSEGRTPAKEVGGMDSLDAHGRLALRVPLESLRATRPGRAEISVAITDINRQTVGSSTAVQVNAARLYVLARRQSHGWYWSVGQPATVEIRTATPDGHELTGIPVIASIVRRQWRWDGSGHWMDSVVRTVTVRSARAPVPVSFTPASGGLYELRLSAADGRGGVARTTLAGYAVASGSGWWAQSPYHLPLVTEHRALAVGDSTQVLFDSPFDLAEAWITLEREGILERRRMEVRRGPNVVRIRIAEAFVPNVFVSVLLVRRTDGATRPDSAAQLMRMGYVEIPVKTERKRLTVAVEPVAREFAPGDTASIRVRVSNADGRPERSEVTLWAVDEGVLALTDWKTPDPLARLYQPRGLGAQTASTLTSVLTSSTSLDLAMSWDVALRGRVASVELNEVVVTTPTGASVPDERGPAVSLRRQFRSTAFYIARGRTDSTGRVQLSAKLPDNLTTYRVVAVAVGATDRFGSGETTLLVTRPLVARPTLPRFVRASDTLVAGAAVNVRDGTARHVTVAATSEGIVLRGDARRTIELTKDRGAEARFAFAVPSRDRAADSVVVRLHADDGAHGDAVEARLPVRADFFPRTHTDIGVVRGTTQVLMDLPRETDPARSRLTLRIGTTPLAPMIAAYDQLRAYPYDCTEQISSAGRALIAVWRITRDRDPNGLRIDVRSRLQALADALVRRQRPDGAIRYWDDHDWSTPWLTTYAGLFLLEARDQGITVDRPVLTRIARYLGRSSGAPIDTGGMNRYERRARRLALGDGVAAADFLRQFGQPDETLEERLLAVAPQMTWEDRLRLAEVLAPRHDARAVALVDAAWASVTRAGRRVDLPDSAISDREFPSHLAPAAQLLTATVALRPDQPLLGGLAETVMQQVRAEGDWAWSTQDFSGLVLALAALQGDDATPRDVRVERDGRALLAHRVGVADSVAALPLEGLLERQADGRMRLRLTLAGDGGRGPLYYAVSVDEVPSAPPVTPDIKGIAVERWYERFADGRPVTSVTEGELVRVRLRVTVPTDRQFVALDDPLPAGLEPVDLSLRTSGTLQPFATPASEAARAEDDRDRDSSRWQSWLYGSWDDGAWSPWEHKAMHDDRVTWFARVLWKGTYTAAYVARATTAGNFVRPPAHAEEMYNPALQGRSDGGRFGVEEKRP